MFPLNLGSEGLFANLDLAALDGRVALHSPLDQGSLGDLQVELIALARLAVHILGILEDEIDAARAKAEFYYDRYFEEVKPTGTPLRKFARQMQNRKFYTLAERSYRRMI